MNNYTVFAGNLVGDAVEIVIMIDLCAKALKDRLALAIQGATCTSPTVAA